MRTVLSDPKEHVSNDVFLSVDEALNVEVGVVL